MIDDGLQDRRQQIGAHLPLLRHVVPHHAVVQQVMERGLIDDLPVDRLPGFGVGGPVLAGYSCGHIAQLSQRQRFPTIQRRPLFLLIIDPVHEGVGVIRIVKGPDEIRLPESRVDPHGLAMGVRQIEILQAQSRFGGCRLQGC